MTSTEVLRCRGGECVVKKLNGIDVTPFNNVKRKLKRRKPRRFKGAGKGEWLAAWLNSDRPKETEERRRIVELIHKLQAYLQQHADFLEQGPYRVEHPDETSGVIGEYIRTTFNPGLAPVYSPLEFGPHPKLQPVPRADRQFTSEVMRGWMAFEKVCALFDMGRIQSLFPCEWCGKWMFAKLPDNRERMHKAPCKKEWLKIKMREYMKRKRGNPNFDGTGFFEA